MQVGKAITIITKIVAGALQEYEATEEAYTTNAEGALVRVAHSLDALDEEDKLFYLDMAIKDVALSASPISLLESAGSVASELRRVSATYYIRVPKEPIVGELLDIDDGLAYAVVYKALSSLWRDFGEYDQKSDSIINTYIQAYRTYLEELIEGVVGTGSETYLRFSADGETWQDSFTLGDKFISFRKIDTDTWTTAIEFIGKDGVDGAKGSDGADGGAGTGVSTFKDLTDTPEILVAGKFLKVNTEGSGIELTDAPSSSGLAGANPFGDKVFFSDSAEGIVSLDASSNNVFYLYPTANIELRFTPFDDGGSVSSYWGTTYTFMLVSTNSTAIVFDANENILGDATVALGTDSASTGITMTILKMVYTGYDWYVISRTVITDANG